MVLRVPPTLKTDCPERERLAEAVQLATNELRWLHEEEYRLVVEEPERLNSFDEVMRDTQARWHAAMEGFRRHVEEHGCDGVGADANTD